MWRARAASVAADADADAPLMPEAITETVTANSAVERTRRPRPEVLMRVT
jgi:hypothetical protein